MKSLSIIIVNWNTWPEAVRCVEAVRQTAQAGSYQITLIDNASAENKADEFKSRFPGVDLEVIRNSGNIGFARACNQGILRSRSPYILLLNPDTEVQAGAIDQSLRYLENHREAAVLGSRLLNPDRTLQRWTAGRFPSLLSAFNHYFFFSVFFPYSKFFKGMFLSGDPQSEQEVDWVCGAFLLARRAAIEDAGVLDERFFLYGEDVEWCYRFGKKGWKVIYFPEAETLHDSGRSVSQLSQGRCLKGLEGLSLFYSSHHPGKLKHFLFDAITAAGFLLRTLLNFLRGSVSGARLSFGFFSAALSLVCGPARKRGAS